MSADSNGRPWCWLDDDADADVIVPSQPSIALYENPRGDLVLRQDTEDDHFVWFRREHAAAVALGILELAGLDIADLITEPAQDATKPMAGTGAARQKRYRQRKKKEPALFDGEESDVTRDVTRDESAA